MRDASTRISVIICAYTLDRWDDLTAAVDSVRVQTLTPEQVIVVVDHNDELLVRAREAFSDLVVTSNQERAGLSGARNSGLALATGDIVAFVDDDAVASEFWLEELADKYTAEEVLGVGGLIVPLWECDRPGWFPREFDWVLGCTYAGMSEGKVRNLIGANMSMRRDVLTAIGGFSHELGRTRTNALGAEETGACIRATQLLPGGYFLLTREASVQHRVPATRATWRYFGDRCWAEGLSKASLARAVGGRDGLASERRHALVQLPKASAVALREFVTGDRAGLARAGAIVYGLGLAATAYAFGRLTGAGSSAEPEVVAPAIEALVAESEPEGVEAATAGAAALVATPEPEVVVPVAAPDARPVAAEPAAPDVAVPVVALATEGAPDTEATPRRLKLLMVTPRYRPLVGGVENHVAEVASRLSADVDITVLTTDLTGELPAAEVLDGVEVVRVRAWPRKRDYYVAPRIYGEIVGGDWDLVHVQSYHTAVAPIAMLGALSSGVPFVLTFHGGGHSSRSREALRATQWLALRPLLARARKLVAVADFEAERFSAGLGLPREQFCVIPNGSDLPKLASDELDALAAGAGHTIVSVGRLERYKGHHRVIAAMPAVLRDVPEAKLRIIGSGPYRQELERLITQLDLGGSVSIEEIPPADRLAMARALAGSALFVLMSEFETHPIAVIEALSLGRPALVADTSGLAELASQGFARALPSDASTAAIAAAIVEELRSPRDVPRLDASTWQECSERLLALYTTVLSASPEDMPAGAVTWAQEQ